MSEPSTPSRSPWNPFAVVFNTLGVLVGLSICVLGLTRSYHMIDSIWFQYLGEINVKVISQKASAPSELNEYHHTTFEIPATGEKKAIHIRVNHKQLYDYIKQQINPASDQKIEAVLVLRNLSRRYYLARVGPIRLATPPKSAELIFYVGLLVLGAAVAFTALRDLRTRWVRRGLGMA